MSKPQKNILKVTLANPEKSSSLTYDTIDYKVKDFELK